MSSKKFVAKLSNPASTGGSGYLFEAEVQASFVALMLAKGNAPCLLPLPITKIQLQNRKRNYNIDDLVVFLETPNTAKQKMLAQIKESIKISNNKTFQDVIASAWYDYNDAGIFEKNRDVIALITGPLSAVDIAHTRDIFEWARATPNAKDFIDDINRPYHASKYKTAKFRVFKALLKKANAGKDLSNEQLHDFLRHFHILSYDLDIKAGVVLSLLHSLMAKCSTENVRNLWGRIVNEVQRCGKNSGEITLDSLPPDLVQSFKPVESIPMSLVSSPAIKKSVTDWNLHQNAADLYVANLLGAWTENSVGDITIIERLSGEGFQQWLSKIQDIVQLPDSPISVKNGVWKVKDRLLLWRALGGRASDTNLKLFKESALIVLGEIDPQFELPKNERYLAGVKGKLLVHSEPLRIGISETVALLGAHSDALTNCTTGIPQAISAAILQELLLGKNDWRIWGSLNYQLPVLAEAAPEVFLHAVSTALKDSPSTFDSLFDQESSGVMGRIYTTGLLWGLENLAWDEQHLVQVTVILGELAKRDPGGNYANRPLNSLTTIFLPWFPQTNASVEKRKVAIQTLMKEAGEPGWKVLLSLLPGSQQVSSGSHKPKWRNPVPSDMRPKVTHEDYWSQVSFYSNVALEEAKKDFMKLVEFIPSINHLPPAIFKGVFAHLQSPQFAAMPEGIRYKFWGKIDDYLVRLRTYPEKDGTLTDEDIKQLRELMGKLAPNSPSEVYPRLFSMKAIHLYLVKGDWEESQRQLEVERQKAIKAVLAQGSVRAVVDLAANVEDPSGVGVSLANIADFAVDGQILPKFLEDGSELIKKFVAGYVWVRYRNQGDKWVNEIKAVDWSAKQKSRLLTSLPFSPATWQLAEKILGKSEGDYWREVFVNPYQTKSGLELAITKLLEYGRPKAAVGCFAKLAQEKEPYNANLAMDALLGVGKSAEPAYTMDGHDTVELIKSLQGKTDTNKEKLLLVEWLFVKLLERDYYSAAPITLENRLASDPRFFLEILQLIYRSTKSLKSKEPVSSQKEQLASNAYQLLSEWQIPPGTQPDGGFSDSKFKEWIKTAKEICVKAGYNEVALIHIGGVLVYAPKDSVGLWINKTVAEELNQLDAEEMRNGFRQELYNSRGVHWVDPTGKPELDLAAKYDKQAEEIENAGYQRLAATLRGLAKSYKQEAERIISENKGRE